MKPVIAIVDDEPGILRSLERLLAGQGYGVSKFASAGEFLLEARATRFDCVVLDVAMPGLDGLELQQQLSACAPPPPVVFLSGEGTAPTIVRAIKAGAVTFLTKPVDAAGLFEAVGQALAEGAKARACERELAALRARFDRLTPRELEVLRHVITGKLNKQIAADLGISEQTTKIHRMHITEKTGLPSVAELVRASAMLHLESAP